MYKFSTWIYKIACNLCYDKLRAERKMKKCSLTDYDSFSEANHDELLHHQELKALIVKITAELSPKQKLIFTLSEIEDLKIEEIRTITGMSAAKIKSNLYLARKHIKSKILHYE